MSAAQILKLGYFANLDSFAMDICWSGMHNVNLAGMKPVR